MSTDDRNPVGFVASNHAAWSIPVAQLDLSVRTANVFKNAEIRFLGDLVNYSEASLLGLQNCGAKTVREVRDILEKYGLALGNPSEGWSAPEYPIDDLPGSAVGKKLEDFDEETRAKFHLRIQELNLSRRAANALAVANVEFVGDLVGKTNGDLLRLPNCGRGSVREIVAKLGTLGLPLGMNLIDWDREAARAVYAERESERAHLLAAIRSTVVSVPEATCLEEELEGVLQALINERDTEIVMKFFGWSGKGRRILESVGQEYNLTRERVRQLAARASKKIADCRIETRWLPKAIDVVREKCPATASTLAAALRNAGISKIDFEPSGLVAACEAFGIEFDIETALIAQKRIYGRPDQIKLIRNVSRSCRHLTSARGCANFDAMCDDIGLPDGDRSQIRDFVMIDARNKWLDGGQQWILAGGLSRNRLSNLITKVLNVTSEVNLSELRRAVGKSRRLEAVPPISVLASFIETSGLGSVSSDVVTASSTFDGALEPGGSEETMVRIFREHGPVLGGDRLQELCIAAGMNPVTIGIYMWMSPVISRLGRGVYSLVGSKVEPGVVEEIEERLSASRRPTEFGWSTRGTLWCAVRLNRNILTSGSVGMPTFVSDLIENTEWQIRFGGRMLDGILKCRNHFLWSVAKSLANAGAEPGDVCVLEFDLQAHFVTLTVGGEDLADAWESGNIDLLPAEPSEVEEPEEAA